MPPGAAAAALRILYYSSPVARFASHGPARRRRQGGTRRRIPVLELPQQGVNKQTRHAITARQARDLAIYALGEKRLRGDLCPRYFVQIRPSDEFHGGVVPPLLLVVFALQPYRGGTSFQRTVI